MHCVSVGSKQAIAEAWRQEADQIRRHDAVSGDLGFRSILGIVRMCCQERAENPQKTRVSALKNA